MSPALPTLKSALRREMRQRLGLLTPSQREAASRALCARLQQQTVWLSARTILFFAPTALEPDIWPLLETALAQGRTVALPRFVPEHNAYEPAAVRDPARDLVTGRFRIREPAPACAAVATEQFDLVLVPGVAFDARGHRLGRGKGYYDRLLARTPGRKCGVAFEEQLVDAVPVEPGDVRVDCIVTPARWLDMAG
jgi:5-formyltetrahydrofolate cyclo-ligase